VERRSIVFSGRVQGVGFRMTTVQFAENLPLAGTVRNTEEGDVELVVEGEAAQIDTLISRLREHFGSFIRNISQTPSRATGLRGGGIRIIH
jgi:acylphosphatase